MPLNKKAIAAGCLLVITTPALAGGIKGPLIPKELIVIGIIILIALLLLIFYSIVIAARAYRTADTRKGVLAALLGSSGLVFFVTTMSGGGEGNAGSAAIFFLLLIPCVVTIGYLIATFIKIPEGKDEISTEIDNEIKTVEDESN